MISALTHAARLARAAFVFAREGVFGVVDPSLVPPPGQLALRIARLVERPGAKSGPRLSRALTRLGPAYLKLGQFLATRPDVVGATMARDLESLQDRLPPFPQEEAEAVVAAALERPVTQAFANFSPAVAAASIAQVHRGEVENDGVRKQVAIKVLRPNVATRFRRDLADFFFVANKAEAHSAEARRLRLIEVINTMSRSVAMEMDLRLEAAALSEMAENTRDDPDFRVPTVDWDRTTHNVLTMEWIDGIALNDHAQLEAAHVDRPDLGRKVIQSFLPSRVSAMPCTGVLGGSTLQFIQGMGGSAVWLMVRFAMSMVAKPCRPLVSSNSETADGRSTRASPDSSPIHHPPSPSTAKARRARFGKPIDSSIAPRKLPSAARRMPPLPLAEVNAIAHEPSASRCAERTRLPASQRSAGELHGVAPAAVTSIKPRPLVSTRNSPARIVSTSTGSPRRRSGLSAKSTSSSPEIR